MPALRKKGLAAKTHAARKPAGKAASAKSRAKAKSRKGGTRKKVSWYARQKQKIADFRDRILSYRLRALVAGSALLAIALYITLAAGGGVWLADEINDVSRRTLVATGLSVQQIRVEGRHRTDLDQVRTAIGVVQGDSILHYDVDAARARLESIDWIEDAKVIRFLPRTIHVVITERQPVAIWQKDGQLHLVDATGYVLAEFRDAWAMDLPLVVGSGAPVEAATLFKVLDAFPAIRDNFASAIRVADRRWNLRLENGIEIRLPAENIHFALARIVKYNEEHDLLKQEIKSVDLRLPDRIYLKLTDEEADRLWSPKSKA